VKDPNQIKNNFISGQISKSDYISKITDCHKLLFSYSDFLEDTEIKRIEITSEGVVLVSIRDVKMLLREGDKRVAYAMALNFGSYESNELSLIFDLVKNSKNVLDIGANCGWFALELAKKYSDKNIYCFEPVFEIYSVLQANIKLNEFPNIYSFNYGMSDNLTEQEMFFNNSDSAVSSMKNICESVNTKKRLAKFSSVDKFKSDNKLKIDFLKCDVEGAELLVLRGALETIIADKPIIFAELVRKWTKHFSYHPNDLINFLNELGYKSFVVDLEKPALRLCEFISEDDLETNFFFLNSIAHQALINNLDT
jgi:FkbM family methyltransferase